MVGPARAHRDRHTSALGYPEAHLIGSVSFALAEHRMTVGTRVPVSYTAATTTPPSPASHTGPGAPGPHHLRDRVDSQRRRHLPRRRDQAQRHHQPRAGYYDSTNGNQQAVALFTGANSTPEPGLTGETGKTHAAALAGATVVKVEEWVYFEHWNYTSGGTARIGRYAGAAMPATYTGASPTITSPGWPRQAGRWIDVTAATDLAQLAAGNVGLTLGPGVGTDKTYYGRAHGPADAYPLSAASPTPSSEDDHAEHTQQGHPYYEATDPRRPRIHHPGDGDPARRDPRPTRLAPVPSARPRPTGKPSSRSPWHPAAGPAHDPRDRTERIQLQREPADRTDDRLQCRGRRVRADEPQSTADPPLPGEYYLMSWAGYVDLPAGGSPTVTPQLPPAHRRERLLLRRDRRNVPATGRVLMGGRRPGAASPSARACRRCSTTWPQARPPCHGSPRERQLLARRRRVRAHPRRRGALDLSIAGWTAAQVWQLLKEARARGLVLWHRTAAQGFTPHAHGIVAGCPHLSGLADPVVGTAAWQIKEYRAGRNGSPAAAPTTDPRPRRRDVVDLPTGGTAEHAHRRADRRRRLGAPDPVHRERVHGRRRGVCRGYPRLCRWTNDAVNALPALIQQSPDSAALADVIVDRIGLSLADA